MKARVFCAGCWTWFQILITPHNPGPATSGHRVLSPGDKTMNASLPESVRKALETVTLEDNLQRRLQHKYAAGGVAARGVFGDELVGQGGV